MSKVKPIPAGYHTLTPYLIVRGAAKAIEFYKKAFGAEEIARMSMPGGDQIMHAELRIGDSVLMLSDEFPKGQCRSPQSLGGTATSVHIYAENADATFDRAVKAGATVVMPLADMFWGDRFGKLSDPFGHHWSVGTHQRDLTPAEIRQGAKEAMAKMAK